MFRRSDGAALIHAHRFLFNFTTLFDASGRVLQTRAKSGLRGCGQAACVASWKTLQAHRLADVRTCDTHYSSRRTPRATRGLGRPLVGRAQLETTQASSHEEGTNQAERSLVDAHNSIVCCSSRLTVIMHGVTLTVCDQNVQVCRYSGAFEGSAGWAIRQHCGCCAT